MTYHLILITPKHLMESTPKEWQTAITKPSILFTGIEAKKYIEINKFIFNQICDEIYFFDKYQETDLIEKAILILSEKYNIGKITALAEVDMLRAARARKLLMIEGQTIESALMFRDKYLMKEQVCKVGILTPQFAKVDNAIDLINFIKQFGYPIIIKPCAGRGSFGTLLINNDNDLDKYLINGLFSKFDCSSSYLVEQFIDGEIYHVDGLISSSKLAFISASRYINNCLSFISGASLGSITLLDNNHIKQKLICAAEKVLFEALLLPTDTLFHIEFFVTSNDEILFCEAASRLGGGNINEQISLSYDFNIKIEFIKTQCFKNYNPLYQYKQKNVIGRLLIPPRIGNSFKYSPTICDYEWVKSYNLLGIIDKKYSAISMSNQEIAHFIFESDSEVIAIERLAILNDWFNTNTVWE